MAAIIATTPTANGLFSGLINAYPPSTDELQSWLDSHPKLDRDVWQPRTFDRFIDCYGIYFVPELLTSIDRAVAAQHQLPHDLSQWSELDHMVWIATFDDIIFDVESKRRLVMQLKLSEPWWHISKAKYSQEQASYFDAQLAQLLPPPSPLPIQTRKRPRDEEHESGGGLFKRVRTACWGLISRGLWQPQSNAELTVLWTHLSRTAIEVHDDGSRILLLPPNSISLLSISTSTVFVRACYDQLADIILADDPDPVRSRNMVTGTPGIGKSIFGVYLLYLCAQRSKPVVYQLGAERLFFSFDSSGNPTARSANADEYYWLVNRDRNLLYLVDNDSPAELPGVWISSPRQQSLKWIKYRKSWIRFVPLWDDDEVARLLHHCYPHVDQSLPIAYTRRLLIDTGATRQLLFGAVPRYLVAPHIGAYIESLYQAVTTVSFQQILFSIANPVRFSPESHMILHMYPIDDEFFQPHIRFASNLVKNLVFKVVAKKDEAVVRRMMQQLSDIPAAAALRGVWFKVTAHTQLQRGGQWKCRSLTNSNVSNGEFMFTLPDCSCTRFRQLVEVSQSLRHDTYYWPTISNFPAADSFVISSADSNIMYAFQMTVSTKHPVVWSGILALGNMLGSGKRLVLVFVVPSDIYPEFKAQTLLTAEKKAVAAANQASIQQYVLELPTTEPAETI